MHDRTLRFQHFPHFLAASLSAKLPVGAGNPRNRFKSIHFRVGRGAFRAEFMFRGVGGRAAAPVALAPSRLVQKISFLIE